MNRYVFPCKLNGYGRVYNFPVHLEKNRITYAWLSINRNFLNALKVRYIQNKQKIIFACVVLAACCMQIFCHGSLTMCLLIKKNP